MENKFKVITLCGSTRFKNEFHITAERLTKDGNIVLLPHCYSHFNNEILSDNEKQMLISMHYQMIDMSDEVYVINVGGYIGDNTKSEIDYAINAGKNICYLEFHK